MIDLSFYPKNFSGKLFKTYLNFPEHPANVRIENIIGTFFFKKGIQIRNKDGVVFQLEANDWMTRIMIEEKCYEENSIRLALQIMEKGGIFFDIGANFGLFTCILSKLPGVTTYSFEPNYDVVNTLVRNIRLNKITGNATVINAAVSDKNKLVNFSIPHEQNKGTGRYDSTNTGGKGGLYVSTVSLEEVINSLSVPYITLIKIDIEGNEMDVLGAFDFNKIPVHNIIMEFKGHATISFEQLKSFFESKNYTLKNIKGDLVNDEKDIIEDNLWLFNNKQLY